MTALSFGAALVLAAVFAAAGLAKVAATGTFEAQLADYGLLSSRASALAARIVPVAELAASVLLLAGIFVSPDVREIGAGLGGLLLLCFLVALLTAHSRGRSVPCACFGGGGDLELIGAHNIVRTALLIGLAPLAALRGADPNILLVAAFAAALSSTVVLTSEPVRAFTSLRLESSRLLDTLLAEQDSEQLALQVQDPR